MHSLLKVCHIRAQRTFGMATENIANNGFGAITTEGLVRDVNTAAFTEGDMLWLGVNGIKELGMIIDLSRGIVTIKADTVK